VHEEISEKTLRRCILLRARYSPSILPTTAAHGACFRRAALKQRRPLAMFDLPYISTAQSLLKAWASHRLARIALISAGILVAAAAAVLTAGQQGTIPLEPSKVVGVGLTIIAFALVVGVLAYQGLEEQTARRKEVETAEQRVRENPQEPQLAWDLARNTLEHYLDRNLRQIRSIYWLTLAVMGAGFAVIVYGLMRAFQAPDKDMVAIVSSASGVLISFIGGSFLLIYRSILAQSAGYVTVLERINAVGMAVQVIASIPESNVELRSQTTAGLAKQLLQLYGSRAATERASAGEKTAVRHRRKPSRA
jgi:hypothetical protein